MRPKKTVWYRLLALIISFILLHFLLSIKEKFIPYTQYTLPKIAEKKQGKEKSPYDYVGEKIIYDIKLGALNLGSASFTYVEKTELNGTAANFMTFETRAGNFCDLEKIYSDPETLLPLRIERSIVNWFTNEQIIEEYDQKAFAVTITKTQGKKRDKFVIQKKAPIQNAILLPQYVRRLPNLDNDITLTAYLPTRSVKIKLDSLEEISVPAGKFKAYHFESVPKQIEIWITADERRIPVKIQGIGLFGYLMVMKQYTPSS